MIRVAGRLSQFVLAAAVGMVTPSCSGGFVNAPDPNPNVQVTLQKQSYVSSDTVTVWVRNVSTATLTYPYGFCKTELQEERGTDWITVTTPSDGCPLALGLLGPGATVPNRYVLPPNLTPGRYRLSMPSPRADGSPPQPPLPSPSFSVNSVILAH